ncbi:MAG: hypothetical protein R6X34_23250, partial [Chloroflexota bacterium]
SHHANKAGTYERGSTSLRAAMDTMMRAQRHAGGSFTLSCEKLKDGGEQWHPQAFSLVVNNCVKDQT